MDQEPKQQAKRLTPLTLVLIIIIVLLVAAAAVLALGKFGGDEPETENLGNASTPLIGYEEGVTVVDDPDAFQKAYDEAVAKAKEGGIPFEFQNEAVGTDGSNFACYIANPADAAYDIYIQIFSDNELTDQLYLSKLIPPGKAMREIKLDHALEVGTHRVIVVLTQMEDDHATIRQQTSVTMDFTVNK